MLIFILGISQSISKMNCSQPHFCSITGSCFPKTRPNSQLSDYELLTITSASYEYAYLRKKYYKKYYSKHKSTFFSTYSLVL